MSIEEALALRSGRYSTRAFLCMMSSCRFGGRFFFSRLIGGPVSELSPDSIPDADNQRMMFAVHVSWQYGLKTTVLPEITEE